MEEIIVISKMKGTEKGKDYIIESIYNLGNWSGIEEMLRKLIGEWKDEYIIIEGDFNLRIEEKSGLDELRKMNRKFKDKVVGNGERKVVNLVNKVGDYIINRIISGDKEGEYAYIKTRDCTVIDYIIVNEICNNRVIRFKVDSKIDSNHLPLILTMRSREEEEESSTEENHIKNIEERTVI